MFWLQIYEIKLSPKPSLTSQQGKIQLHLKIWHMQKTKKEWGVYKIEVPDVKKTNAEANGSGGGGGGGVGNNCGSGGGRQSMSCDDGIAINLNNGRTIGGDIKVECSASHVLGKKKLFSFWFNTHFVWDKRDDGKCSDGVLDDFEFISTTKLFFSPVLFAEADNNNPFVEYVIPKSDLDRACKDEICKIFPANFEVSFRSSPSSHSLTFEHFSIDSFWCLFVAFSR